MLIDAETTRPMSSLSFHQQKRNYYFGKYKNGIINQKYWGVKIREPKDQILGTMVTPSYAVKCEDDFDWINKYSSTMFTV